MKVKEPYFSKKDAIAYILKRFYAISGRCMFSERTLEYWIRAGLITKGEQEGKWIFYRKDRFIKDIDFLIEGKRNFKTIKEIAKLKVK